MNYNLVLNGPIQVLPEFNFGDINDFRDVGIDGSEFGFEAEKKVLDDEGDLLGLLGCAPVSG